MALIHKVLVPTDFSEGASRALDYAAEIAAPLGAPLLLLHVYALPGVYTPDGVVPLPMPAQVDFDAGLERGLSQLVERARSLGVAEVQSRSVTGDAWREIVRAAKESGCDLIVMGTHGRSGLEHLILGSTAERVIRKAHCPVLAVKVS